MICLVGESASGKSTVEKVLVSKYGYEKIVSYTTRKPRQSEVDGVDYHFITDEQFERMIDDDKFAEYAIYNGWQYGTAKADCTKNKVIVVTPHGLRALRKNCDFKITAIYIDVPRRDRLIKILQRGDNIEEAYRRSLSDVGMFDGIEDECEIVIDNYGYERTPEQICLEIIRLSSQNTTQNSL